MRISTKQKYNSLVREVTSHVKEEKVSTAGKNRRHRQQIRGDACYRALKARNTEEQELAAVGGPGLELATEPE